MLHARTHRGSKVNRDEDFLLAVISFLWRGIHSRSLGLRRIGAQLLPRIREAKIVNQMFHIVPLWKLWKPGAVRLRLSTASCRSCSSFLRICSSRLSGSWTGCKSYCLDATEGHRDARSCYIPESVIVSSKPASTL